MIPSGRTPNAASTETQVSAQKNSTMPVMVPRQSGANFSKFCPLGSMRGKNHKSSSIKAGKAARIRFVSFGPQPSACPAKFQWTGMTSGRNGRQIRCPIKLSAQTAPNTASRRLLCFIWFLSFHKAKIIKPFDQFLEYSQVQAIHNVLPAPLIAD